MRLVKGAIPVAVSLAVVAAVTAILWYVKLPRVGPHHPVFFYLLPIALVAVLYGSRPAMLCAVAAICCAAFFLYDPIYSFHVANRLEFGDLVCFAVLALIGGEMRASNCCGRRRRANAPLRRSNRPVADAVDQNCGRELIQAHDVGEVAHLVLLLGIEAHEQRDSRRFETLHLGAVGIGGGELRLRRAVPARVARPA